MFKQHTRLRHWGHTLVLTLFMMTFAVAHISAQAQTGDVTQVSSSKTIFITGSNRGIGLEFVRQYADGGWNVIATCRKPATATELQALATEYDNITVEELDITDVDEIASLKKKYNDTPFDVLLNNAALLGSRADQAFGKLDWDLFENILRVNVTGTMRVTDAFIDNVRASDSKKLVTLGSAAGSIQMMGNTPDYYPYRASKAALHLMTNALSHELKKEGILVGLINPGLVDTRGLSDLKEGDEIPEDFKLIMPLVWQGVIKLDSPEDAVEKMITLIDNLTPEQSGAFLNADGTPLPW